jgi:hypothetical protein
MTIVLGDMLNRSAGFEKFRSAAFSITFDLNGDQGSYRAKKNRLAEPWHFSSMARQGGEFSVD